MAFIAEDFRQDVDGGDVDEGARRNEQEDANPEH